MITTYTPETTLEAMQVALFRSLTARTIDRAQAAATLAQAMASNLTPQELEQAKAGAIDMAVREQERRQSNEH
jgi:hypothetical protein